VSRKRSTSAKATISSNCAGDLRAAHAQNRAVEEDVLAAGQLGVEAGAYLQQRADPAADPAPAAGGLGDAREDLEQGALARAVAADDPHHLAALDLERDVFQRPQVVRMGIGRLGIGRLVAAAEHACQRVAQGIVALLARAQVIELG
jgi:hypothetical protein